MRGANRAIMAGTWVAGWAALYDIRASGTETETPAIALGYLAQVTQNTGEDWTDTAMTLSTARPALASIEPELSAWYLEPYAPPVMRAKRAMDTVRELLREDTANA